MNVFVLLALLSISVAAPSTSRSEDVPSAGSPLAARHHSLLAFLQDAEFYERLSKLTEKQIETARRRSEDVVRMVSDSVEPMFSRIDDETNLSSSDIANGIAVLRGVDGKRILEGQRFDGKAPAILSNKNFEVNVFTENRAEACIKKLDNLRTSDEVKYRRDAVQCLSDVLLDVGQSQDVTKAIDAHLEMNETDRLMVPLISSITETDAYRANQQAVETMKKALKVQKETVAKYRFGGVGQEFCAAVADCLKHPALPQRVSTGNGHESWMDSLFEGTLASIRERLRPATDFLNSAVAEEEKIEKKPEELIGDCESFVAATKQINAEAIRKILDVGSCVEPLEEKPEAVEALMKATKVLKDVEPHLRRLRDELVGATISEQERQMISDLRLHLETKKPLASMTPVVAVLHRLSPRLGNASNIVNENEFLKNWVVFKNMDTAVAKAKEYIAQSRLGSLPQCAPEPNVTALKEADRATGKLVELKAANFAGLVATSAKTVARLADALKAAVRAEQEKTREETSDDEMTADFIRRAAGTREAIEKGMRRAVGRLQSRLVEENTLLDVADNFRRMASFSKNGTIEKEAGDTPRNEMDTDWRSVSMDLDTASRALEYLQRALDVLRRRRKAETMQSFEEEERKRKEAEEMEKKKANAQDDGLSWWTFASIGLLIAIAVTVVTYRIVKKRATMRREHGAIADRNECRDERFGMSATNTAHLFDTTRGWSRKGESVETGASLEHRDRLIEYRDSGRKRSETERVRSDESDKYILMARIIEYHIQHVDHSAAFRRIRVNL